MNFDLGISAEGSSSPKKYILVVPHNLPPLLVTCESDGKFFSVGLADEEFTFNEKYAMREEITAKGRQIIQNWVL